VARGRRDGARPESNLRNDYHPAHGAIRRGYLYGDDSMNLAKHATKMLGATLVAFAVAGPALADGVPAAPAPVPPPAAAPKN
jgi:hypothetical protein